PVWGQLVAAKGRKVSLVVGKLKKLVRAQQIGGDENPPLVAPGQVADPMGKGDLAGQIAPVWVDRPQRGDPFAGHVQTAEKEDTAAVIVEDNVVDPGRFSLCLGAAGPDHLGNGEHQ